MRKKKRQVNQEILPPEIERQLPAPHTPIPSLDEINRLVERITAAERHRARQELFRIITVITAMFMLMLGGVAWFTRDILQQLKAERSLSEKSREDMLNLVYSGITGVHNIPNARQNPDAPPMAVPEHSQPVAGAPARQPAVTATRVEPVVPEPEPEPEPIEQAIRKSIDVRLTEDMLLRLPIPPP